MSEVEFNTEEQILQRKLPTETPRAGKMAVFLLESGMIKSPEQANYVIVGMAVLILLASVFIFSFSKDTPPTIPVDAQGNQIIPGQIPGGI